MLIGYEVITCCNSSCGISFAVPSEWQRARRRDHSWFYCPNGHHQHYPGESTEEKLRLERDRLAQRVAQRDDEIADQRDLRAGVERRLNATKGVVTRIKNRVGHGICPCCTRSFGNLAMHMKTQHPTYAKSDGETMQ